MICASSVCAWLVAATFATTLPQMPSGAPRERTPLTEALTTQELVPRNTRLAFGGSLFVDDSTGPGSSFLVSEFGQGATDLNGDGDTQDRVLHIVSQTGGGVLDVGLAAFDDGPLQAGQTVALGVLEYAQGGQDLNGDGDTLDSVLHLVDAGSGAVTNVGLAVHPQLLRLSPSFAALAVSEADQGGQDLNGDGDALDEVLHQVATAGGAVTNLGLAVKWVDVAGDVIAAPVFEVDQGQDLNGDGVLDDVVPHVVDAAQGTVFSLAHFAEPDLVISPRYAVYGVLESSAGTDLNGDGDLLDPVAHALDVSTGTTINTGLGAGGSPRIVGDRAVLGIYEHMQGQDLNGDGDQMDCVPHVVHLPTNTASNSGLALDNAFFPAGRRVAVRVSEQFQGGQDLNGDGDAMDAVLHVLDLTTGAVTNTGFAAMILTPGNSLIGFLVREFAQGSQDLNGDGDSFDYVWHAYDPVLGKTANLGLSSGTTTFGALAGDDFLVVHASESTNGAKDLNGDGDASDVVPMLFQAGLGIQGLGAGVEGLMPMWLSGRRVFLPVHEVGKGWVDLNGDGDVTDHVVHVLDVP